jgi:hypothetical protein
MGCTSWNPRFEVVAISRPVVSLDADLRKEHDFTVGPPLRAGWNIAFQAQLPRRSRQATAQAPIRSS